MKRLDMSTRNERLFVWGLCCVAGLRIFFLAAAMPPPFNEIGETLHFEKDVPSLCRSTSPAV